MSKRFAIVCAIAAQLGMHAVATPQDDTINRAVVELDKAGLPKEAEVAYSQEQADAWRDEVVSHVEAFTGKTFVEPATVLVVRRDAMLTAWEQDLRAQLEGVADADQADMAVVLALMDKIVQVPFMFGRYSTTAKVIHLPAGNATPLLAIMNLREEPLADLMKLIIAHELAHALHAQHVDLKTAYQARTEDERKALDATMEGFAMLVQAGVAERLNLSALNQKLMQASTLSDAKLQTANAFGRRYNEIYLTGHRFFQHHLAQHDMDHVWSILANPPRTYAHVTSPERYGETVATKIDKNLLFEGVEEPLAAVGMQRAAVTLDGESIARTFAPLGADRAKDLAGLVEKAHTLILRRGNDLRSLTCYEMQDAADAPTFLEGIEALFDAGFGKPSESPRQLAGADLTQTRQEFSAGDGRGFLRTLHVANPQNAGDSTTMYAGAVAHDRFVIQCMIAGAKLSPEAIAAVCRTLLDRLANGAAGVPVPDVDETHPLIAALKRVQPMLGAAEWEVDFHPQSKGGLEKQVGGDMEAEFALELGFQTGHAVKLEAKSDPRESRRLAMVSLSQFSDSQMAAAVSKGLGANLLNTFEVFRTALAHIDPGEIQTLALRNGNPCASVETSVTYLGQAAHVAVSATHHGRYVLLIFSMNHALRDVSIDAIVETVTRDLE